MNQEVNVVSYYFSNSRCFPRTVQVANKELNFAENGLRCLVKHGQDIIQIFNMSDGEKLYRLSFEPGARTWKLLGSRTL